MTRSLNHDLNILSPCSLCKSTELYKFCYLSSVCGVINTSGTKRVSKTDRYIILAKYIKYIIISEYVLVARKCKRIKVLNG